MFQEAEEILHGLWKDHGEADCSPAGQEGPHQSRCDTAVCAETHKEAGFLTGLSPMEDP